MITPAPPAGASAATATCRYTVVTSRTILAPLTVAVATLAAACGGAAERHTESGVQGIQAATPVVCDLDRRSLELAVEAYRAMNGEETLPNEADLVAAGFLAEQSVNLDVVGGQVVPAVGVDCA